MPAFDRVRDEQPRVVHPRRAGPARCRATGRLTAGAGTRPPARPCAGEYDMKRRARAEHRIHIDRASRLLDDSVDHVR